jgi:ketosteroid isomerase-like protein
MSLLKPLIIALLVLTSPFVAADDKTNIEKLLNNFLANSVQNDFKNHNSFWADDLIYTSSSGTRFDKNVIIDGIKEEEKSKTNKNTVDESVPTYWAEETDIRLYGNTAIVAFKLAAKWKESGEVKKQYYYNTGTMLKRNNEWQVVAWQATIIPETSE